jgi:hypothetical protein
VPGATITVRVAPSAGEQLTGVAVGIGDTSVDATPSATVPNAYEAEVTVPRTAVGPIFIVAYGTLVAGVAMDFVDIDVNPGPLSALMFSVPPTMGFIGQVRQLEVKGRFADGIVRILTLPEKGTTYSSSNDAILGVNADGLIQARQRGFAEIRVSNRGKTTAAAVNVVVPDPPDNHIPVPDPGPDQIVAPQTLVTLSGAASHDADGGPLTYHWEQESGRIVLLRDPEAAQTVFVSPRVDAEMILEFSLVVSDNKGATSFPTTVRITVRP